MRQSENLRQIGLGVQLRKLREDAGMTTRSVAKALGLSPSSVNRNELGLRAPNREEVSALCALYGITGKDKQVIIGRVGPVKEATAWLRTGPGAEMLASLMVLEREAKSITGIEVTLIPGLAQTADYARCIISLWAHPEKDIEHQVATRLARQAILSKPDSPHVSFLIDEGALHRTLGEPRIMRDQLTQLLTLQRRDNVSVRVIPFDSPPHPALSGPFTVYNLVAGGPYVLVEGPDVGVFVTKTSEVVTFIAAQQKLDDMAMYEESSSALIKQIIGGLVDE